LAKQRKTTSNYGESLGRKAISDEARINQLGALAFDLVESRLRDGTASASEVVQVLRMTSPKEQLELDKLKADTKLSEAKVSAIETNERYEQELKDAMEAWRGYAGKDDGE
jgi:hypothetical protein